MTVEKMDSSPTAAQGSRNGRRTSSCPSRHSGACPSRPPQGSARAPPIALPTTVPAGQEGPALDAHPELAAACQGSRVSRRPSAEPVCARRWLTAEEHVED